MIARPLSSFNKLWCGVVVAAAAAVEPPQKDGSSPLPCRYGERFPIIWMNASRRLEEASFFDLYRPLLSPLATTSLFVYSTCLSLAADRNWFPHRAPQKLTKDKRRTRNTFCGWWWWDDAEMIIKNSSCWNWIAFCSKWTNDGRVSGMSVLQIERMRMGLARQPDDSLMDIIHGTGHYKSIEDNESELLLLVFLTKSSSVQSRMPMVFLLHQQVSYTLNSVFEDKGINTEGSSSRCSC